MYYIPTTSKFHPMPDAACPFTESTGTCDTGYIQCYDSLDGTCILPTQCNNGVNDCSNNSDEGMSTFQG